MTASPVFWWFTLTLSFGILLIGFMILYSNRRRRGHYRNHSSSGYDSGFLDGLLIGSILSDD